MMAGGECTGQPVASTCTNPRRHDVGLDQAAQQWDLGRVVGVSVYSAGKSYRTPQQVGCGK